MGTWIIPKTHAEFISLFFHHTSFFVVCSTNNVSLGRKSVARKKKIESGKTRLLCCPTSTTIMTFSGTSLPAPKIGYNKHKNLPTGKDTLGVTYLS